MLAVLQLHPHTRMFLTAMIPFHKSSIKLKKYRKLEGVPHP
jgi:hypothetical protein